MRQQSINSFMSRLGLLSIVVLVVFALLWLVQPVHAQTPEPTPFIDLSPVTTAINDMNNNLGGKLDSLGSKLDGVSGTINAMATVQAVQSTQLISMTDAVSDLTAQVLIIQSNVLTMSSVLDGFYQDFGSFVVLSTGSSISNTEVMSDTYATLNLGVGALANLSWSSVVLLTAVVVLCFALVVVVWLKK